MSFEVAIHQFQDPRVGITYGFLLHSHEQNKTLGIDAGRARPLLDLLDQKNWTLDELWITHHHFDHTDGLLEVKQSTGCQVTGPKNQTIPIHGLDRVVEEGDSLSFAGHEAAILYAPGHTNDMLNYHFADLGICFVGDVLFPLGCGRIKEGTPEDMWSSLQRLARLPDTTLIYSCHEYADSNAQFALSVEPSNKDLLKSIDNIEKSIKNGRPTIPSILFEELLTNPFLRPHIPEIRATINAAQELSDVEVFAQLRAMKDRF